MKKLLVLTLAFIMLIMASACSKKLSETPKDGFIAKNDSSVKLATPSKVLNPEDIYNSISYIPEMFYGDYKLFGGKDAETKYAEGAVYAEHTIGGEAKNLTTLPIRFTAGEKNLNHKLTFADGYNWAQVSFMRKTSTDDLVLDYFYCSYEIDGKQLIIKPLDSFEVDDESKKVSLDFSDVVWNYDFSFKGRTLTLSSEGKSIELNGGLDPYGEHNYFYFDAYPAYENEKIDGIYNIEYMYDAEKNLTRFVVSNDAESNNHNGIAKLEENGLFTFTVPSDSGDKTYQYVYFYNRYDGVTLTDGKDVFRYNFDYTKYHKKNIEKYMSEEQEGLLEELDENAIKEIAEKTEDLTSELAAAFTDAGIDVTTNSETGEMAIDSSVLFGGDSAELSDEGKAFLDKFVSVYSSVIFSEKYKDFISKTLVEGHTAPTANSTYESGLALSVDRANVVRDYCLSVQTADGGVMSETSLEAVGMSNSVPVKDVDGNINLDASRRVSFKFIINVK